MPTYTIATIDNRREEGVKPWFWVLDAESLDDAKQQALAYFIVRNQPGWWDRGEHLPTAADLNVTIPEAYEGLPGWGADGCGWNDMRTGPDLADWQAALAEWTAAHTAAAPAPEATS
ncbi:hypothetical protein [Catenulispora rubra]|uniref:hypothetical protein n=1 Tax=Catenulispora rubra TaxID=280293 RepID=UPI00189258C8|nr:hypothetical protein [Catenulispora rubra]